MKISYPVGQPTNFITIPDPERRDQKTVKIGTTFKRMVDGSIIPFNHLPPQYEVNMVFNTLKYKKAREFLDFLVAGENQFMLFESDSGTSGQFLNGGNITGTIITSPLALITINDTYKSIAVQVALQDTIKLQAKHLGAGLGNQSPLGDCNTFYVIGATTWIGLAIDEINEEYSRFEGLDGVWSSRKLSGVPRYDSAGFSLQQLIYRVGGEEKTFPIVRSDETDFYTPIFDLDGYWTLSIAQMGFSRINAIGFTLKDYGYILGGQSISQDLISCIERFDDLGGVWTNESDQICVGIDKAYSFSLASKAYVGGGWVGGVSDVLRCFDGNVWTVVKVDPLTQVARSAASGLPNEGLGLIMAGYNPTNSTKLDSATLYSEVLNTLTAIDPLPTPVAHHTGATLGDAVYTVGGDDGTSAIGENNEYTTSLGTWVARLPMQAGKEKFGTISPCSNLGGTQSEVQIPPIDLIPAEAVIITGGVALGALQPRQQTYKWDFGTLAANVAWDMPSNRIAHAQASLFSSVYVIDGDQEGSASPREAFWEFSTNSVWLSKSLKGEYYDAQPRDSSTRTLKTDSSAVGYQGSLYLMEGRYAAQTFERRDYETTAIDRWNPTEGWKANLIQSSSIGFGGYGQTSAVRVEIKTVSTLGLDGITRIENKIDGAIYNVGGWQRSSGGSSPANNGAVTVYSVLENSVSARAPTWNVSVGGVVNLGGDLYATSQYRVNPQDVEKATYRYDPQLDTWNDAMPSTVQTYNVWNYGACNTGDADILGNFGGEDASGVQSTRIQTYDKIANSWSVDTAVLPTGITGCKASLQGFGATGGVTKKLFVYKNLGYNFTWDPSNLAISFKSRGASFGTLAGVESLVGFVWVFAFAALVQTGVNDGSIRAFDEVADSWVEGDIPNLPIGGMQSHGITGVYNSEIYLWSGFEKLDTFGPTTTTNGEKIGRYDPVSKTYLINNETYADLFGSRSAGFMRDSKLYKLGGFDGDSKERSQSHVEVDVGVWGTPVLSNLNRSVWRTEGLYLPSTSNEAIVFGGDDYKGGQNLQDLEVYSRSGDSFSAGKTYPKIHDLTGQVIDGDIYLFFTSVFFSIGSSTVFGAGLWFFQGSGGKIDIATESFINLGVQVSPEGLTAEAEKGNSTSF